MKTIIYIRPLGREIVVNDSAANKALAKSLKWKKVSTQAVPAPERTEPAKDIHRRG